MYYIQIQLSSALLQGRRSWLVTPEVCVRAHVWFCLDACVDMCTQTYMHT